MNNFTRRIVTKTGALFIAGALWVTGLPANAADAERDSKGRAVEEIIVSATYRDTKLIDTPISISALDEQDLKDKGVFDLQDLYTSLPSVSYRSNSGTYNFVTIRGLTSPAGGGSTVGMYVDNIPVTDSGWGGSQIGGMSLDLARVEALKGPQGTLYGEGAMGGAIRYITNDANPNEFDFKVDGMVEQNSKSNDLSNYTSAVVNIPVIQDKLGVRIAAFRRDQAGYLDIGPPRSEKDVNTLDEDGGRIKINWYATDWLAVEATYNYQQAIHEGPNLGHYAYGSDFTDPLFDNGGRDQQEQANLTLEAQWGDIAFTGSFSYFKREVDYAEQTSPRFAEGIQRGANCMAAQQGLLQPALAPSPLAAFGIDDLIYCAFVAPPASHPYPIDAVVTSIGGHGIFRRAEERGVVELRALSTNEDSRWQWVAGVYSKQGYSLNGREEVGLGLQNPFRPGFESVIPVFNSIFAPRGVFETQTDLDEMAAYGEVTYTVNDYVDVLLGLRGSRTTKNVIPGANPGIAREIDDDSISPKLSIAWRPVEGTLAYFTVAQGFRPGFFNSGLLTHNDNLQTMLDGGPPYVNLVSIAADPRADENGDGVIDAADAAAHLAKTNSFVEQEGDEVISYEIGLKSELFDNRMTLIAAAFYSDWKDTYMGIVDRILYTGSGVGGELRYTISGGSAHTQGIELDAVFALTDDLTLTVGGDYTPEAEMDVVPPDTGGAFSNDGTPIPVLPGNRLPNSPEYSLSVNVAYDVALPWNLNGTVHVDYFKVPLSFANVTNELTTPGYHQFNARLTAYTQDRDWRFSIFVKNLTDEVIKFEDNEAGIRFGRPRTIGAEFTWNMSR